MSEYVGRLAKTSALALLLASCETKSTPLPKPSASAVRPAPAPAASSASLVPPRDVPRCRVIALRPSAAAAVDAGAPVVGTALDGADWLDLGKGAEVVLRHALTTREFALRGPGRFLPCFLGTETVLVASGSVETTAGAGARAGAEVIVGTPFGTLHFTDSALEAQVTERALDVKIHTGVAALVPALPAAASADASPPDLVLGPKSRKKLAGVVAPNDLVARCAEASRVLDEPPPDAKGSPSAREALGKWSVAQLKARQTARWACATARAAAAREEGPEASRRWAEIAASDRVWQAGK
jgi:hypothetical protein